MDNTGNEIILIIMGISGIMYLAQTAMTMTLFSDEAIAEMNKNKVNNDE